MLLSAIPVTIGFTKGLYYVSESASSLIICYEVLSGRTASRSISMQFRTVEGEAEGKVFINSSDHHKMCTVKALLMIF